MDATRAGGGLKFILNNRQLPVFLLVGVFCAALDIGVMQSLIRGGVDYKVSTSVGFIVGLCVNYVLHTKITFTNKMSSATLIRFLVVVFVNYLITLGLVFVSQLLSGNPLIGKVVSLPVVAANGFLLSKFWIYR